MLAGLSVGLFRISAELSTRHNDFPASFHPDEGGKASQILSNDRNFYHPQLMLEVAIRLIDREKTPRRQQQVVETGRRGSAYMAAGAAVLLAWAGYFAAGPIGFLLVGATAGLCPALIAHAHYFKEDASLCFGVGAVVCVGAALIWRWHWTAMLLLAALLGGACGLAASGKYVGAVMIVPALLLSLAVTWRRWWILPLCPLLVLGGAYVSWTGINHRAIQNWEDFRYGFEKEKQHGIEGHDNVQIPTPNSWSIRQSWAEAVPHVRAMTIATPLALVVLFVRRRWAKAPAAKPVLVPAGAADDVGEVNPPPASLDPAQKSLRSHWAWSLAWVALCLICYGILLANNKIPFFRYALPLTLLLYVAAALGAVAFTKAIETRFTPAWLIGPAMLAVIATYQWERCEDYLSQFANDSHYRLQHWVNALPQGTRIVADYYTELDDRWMSRIRSRLDIDRRRYAAQAGSVEDLIRRRIQFVIIAGTSFERYVDPATTFVEDKAEFEHRRRFYQTLFERYPVVKQFTAEHPMRAFTNPEIYIFKLPVAEDRRRRQR